MKRRTVLKSICCAAASMAVPGSALAATRRTRWRMVLAWDRDMDLFTRGAFRFAERISLLSQSLLAIDVTVAPKGMTMEALARQVEAGTYDCAHLLSSVYAKQNPAMQWFCDIPFGLSVAGMNAWLYRWGGMKLWKEACLPFGIYAKPMGDGGPGCFAWSKETLDEANPLSGMKIPAQGVAADVLAQVGASPQPLLPTGKATVQALGKGALDAASWYGLHHEMVSGFDRVAKARYLPGWQAPSTRLMLCLNRQSYEKLPAYVRKVVDAVTLQTDMEIQTAATAANAEALKTAGLAGVQSLPLPGTLLACLRDLSHEALHQRAAQGGLARKVHDSYTKAMACMEGRG